MKEQIVKTADCSCEQLHKIALGCGFVVKEGRKHCKVETRDGKFITIIPRHSRLKRETARGIAKKFIQFGGNITIA